MKINFYKGIAYATLVSLSLVACKPKLDADMPASKAELDLSNYVSVGNSLTAGYADGGLYRDAQLNSYPNFIAQQMQLAGGGTFAQPLFSETQANGSGYLKITGWNTDGTPILSEETTNLAVVDALTGQLARHEGANNNYGVPGIRVADVNFAPYAQLNPYFERLLPAGTQKTYTDMVSGANPTFFTCWLGNNDVLGFATRGGDPEANPVGSTPIPTSEFPVSALGADGAITDSAFFAANYKALVDKLTANGAEGVLATIPDIASIPYVTTLNGIIADGAGGVFPVVPLDATTAATLNGLYMATGYSNPGFVAGNNYFVISIDDPNTGTIEVRQMNPATDYILLSAQGLAPQLATGLGVALPNNGSNPSLPNPPFTSLPAPLPNWAVLSAEEVELVRTYTGYYNDIIRKTAEDKGLALVESDLFFDYIKATKTIDGVSISSDFISGGLFSVDGVHLTPKGYAIIANQFIKAINYTYGSAIPLIDVNAKNYRTVVFP